MNELLEQVGRDREADLEKVAQEYLAAAEIRAKFHGQDEWMAREEKRARDNYRTMDGRLKTLAAHFEAKLEDTLRRAKMDAGRVADMAAKKWASRRGAGGKASGSGGASHALSGRLGSAVSGSNGGLNSSN